MKNNTIVQAISFGFLLMGSFYFGFVGRPTEMGLSILAGALALAFANMDKISKFKGAGFEAEMRDQVEAMVAKDSEPPPDKGESSSRVRAFSYDESTEKVIKCLGGSKYTWRTVGGIAQESLLSTRTIRNSLDWLIKNGLAVQVGTGKEVKWGLTEEGRELFNSM